MGNKQSDEEIAEVYNREVSSEDASPPPQLVAEANKRPRLSSNPHEYFPHLSSQQASESTLTLKNPLECEDDTGSTDGNTALKPQDTAAAPSKLKQFTTHFVESLKKPTPPREYDRVEETSAIQEESADTAAVQEQPSFAARFVQALKKPTPMREYDSPDRDAAIIKDASSDEDISAQSKLLHHSSVEEEQTKQEQFLTLESHQKP